MTHAAELGQTTTDRTNPEGVGQLEPRADIAPPAIVASAFEVQPQATTPVQAVVVVDGDTAPSLAAHDVPTDVQAAAESMVREEPRVFVTEQSLPTESVRHDDVRHGTNRIAPEIPMDGEGQEAAVRPTAKARELMTANPPIQRQIPPQRVGPSDSRGVVERVDVPDLVPSESGQRPVVTRDVRDSVAIADDRPNPGVPQEAVAERAATPLEQHRGATITGGRWHKPAIVAVTPRRTTRQVGSRDEPVMISPPNDSNTSADLGGEIKRIDMPPRPDNAQRDGDEPVIERTLPEPRMKDLRHSKAAGGAADWDSRTTAGTPASMIDGAVHIDRPTVAVRAVPMSIRGTVSTPPQVVDTPDAVAVPRTDWVTLRIETPDAGGARIRVAVRGDHVRATILHDDAGVAEHLRTHANELRDALVRRGFPESRLNIQLARAASHVALVGAATQTVVPEMRATVSPEPYDSDRQSAHDQGHEWSDESKGRRESSQRRSQKERERSQS